jgi:hypothetical protein
MAKQPPSNNQTSKSGSTNKTKDTPKPGGAPTETPSKPPFTKEVGDLDMED